jgi:hypothetical protein
MESAALDARAAEPSNSIVILTAGEEIAWRLPGGTTIQAGGYWGLDGQWSPVPVSVSPWIVKTDGKIDELALYIAGNVTASPPTVTVHASTDGQKWQPLQLSVLGKGNGLVSLGDGAGTSVTKGMLLLLQTDRPFGGAATAQLRYTRNP